MKGLTKIIAISLVSFITVVILLLLVARPMLSQINDLHTKSDNQQTELSALNLQVSAYNDARTQLAAVNYKDVIMDAVVKREDLAAAITEIEADAAKTNVTESITITDDQPVGNSKTAVVPAVVPGKKQISEVAYTLQFSAKFPDTLNFMQYLEHLSHFTEISGLSFSAVPAKGSSDVSAHDSIITGNINGVFFIKKP
jgi:hypothetical protein